MKYLLFISILKKRRFGWLKGLKKDEWMKCVDELKKYDSQ